MKKITIIAMSEYTLISMYNFLMEVFANIIEIRKYTVHMYEKIDYDDSDLVVLSGSWSHQMILHKLKDKKIILSHRSIDYSNLDILSNIQSGTSLYLVNDQCESANEAIKQLEQFGYDFNLIPFYPGSIVDPSMKKAITLGEPNLVPSTVEHVFNIGSRVSSISTLTDIAFSLDLAYSVIDTITWSYMSKYASLLQKNRSHLEQIYRSDQIMKNVFDYSENGIAVLSDTLEIRTMNRKFLNMIKLSLRDIIGKNFKKILKTKQIDIDLEEVLGEGHVVWGGDDLELLITGYEIPLAEGKYILVYASYTDELREKEITIREKEKNHNAAIRYNFHDYITNDPKVKQMLMKVKKIAKNDSCVLIQGESGTGKEIIAQSIHNNSNRKNNPFIPLNFAAIQPSLLESELFGYADGSFTGAKKGGNKGLFEKAHRGTIFIDEIGDAPMEFQVRLLRVLQEQEIRRVGDSKRIPIDVRVIVATNKDLIKKIETGSFREDLFYRINVMPIDTIPIRERKGDINLLMENYIKVYFNNTEQTLESTCTSALINYLNTYRWNGNVREIANIADFFSCIKGPDKLDVNDLPSYILQNPKHIELSISEMEKNILMIISENPRIGRYSICRQMVKKGYDIKEGKVRSLISSLRNKELIIINNTRGGCEVSSSAYGFLQNILLGEPIEA